MFGFLLSLFNIPNLLSSIVGVVSKHVADPDVMAEVKAQIAATVVAESVQQGKIEEAAQTNPDKYIRYVRASVEWICIYAILMAVVVNPFLVFFGYDYPHLPMNMVLPLLYALLGIGVTNLAGNLFGRKTL